MTLELPIAIVLLLLEDGNQWENRFESYSGEIREDGDAFGANNWRGCMKTSLSVLEIELVKFGGQLLVLVQKEAREEVRDSVAVLAGQLIDDLLEHTQVRAVGALDEAVKENDHFIELEGVLGHNADEVIKTILQEEELGALWVSVQKLVGDAGQGLNHELKNVIISICLLILARSLACDHWVDILEGCSEEGE